MAPLLQFRAGRAVRQGDSNTVVCQPERGLVTLEEEDGLLHFYYRDLSHSSRPILEDLIIFPGDASFLPVPTATSTSSDSATPPRVHVLKFASSSARSFYWEQEVDWTAEQYRDRTNKVNELIGGTVPEDDAAMEVEATPAAPSAPSPFETPAPSRTLPASSSSSAPAVSAPAAPKKAFGSEAQLAQLQNILAGLGGGAGAAAGAAYGGASGGMPAFTLPDLLPSSSLPSLLSSLPASSLSHLCSFLPSSPLLPTSTPQERLTSLIRAFSSPEFRRSLGGLDRALRTGATGPLMGSLGLGEGAARGAEEFVEAVQKQAEEEQKKEEGAGGQ